MADKQYIERGALINKIFPIGMIDDGRYAISAKAVKTAIDKAPTADVAPVVHGKWVDIREEDCCEGEEPHIVVMVNGHPLSSCYCSECEEWLVASDEYLVNGNYCPNCGARMDGGKHGKIS